MKKVIFIINSLRGGGAEKVVALIIKYLDRKEFEPVLILFQKKGSRLKDIEDMVRIYDLKKRMPVLSFMKLVIKTWFIIKKEKPDIVVSFMGAANLVALINKKILKSKIKVIAGIRNLVLIKLKYQRFFLLRYYIHKYLFPASDLVLTNSFAAKEEVEELLNVPGKKIQVIGNPLEIDEIRKLSELPLEHKWYNEDVPVIISAGKLTRAKGFEYLITAFARIIRDFKCRLIILGDGKLKSSLAGLIDELNIKDHVDLPGFRSNPYNYMARSDVFVLSSLWEGLPNVLLEAMACEIPVITTEYSRSVHEIIEDEVNGLVVKPGDADLLAQAILRLLKSKELKEKFIRENKRKIERFNAEDIVKEYEDLIVNV
ncbi:glycosyltransferase [Elusimicrobiota bacterium]